MSRQQLIIANEIYEGIAKVRYVETQSVHEGNSEI